ncbi:MAG: hypothetical protein Q9162_003328 [Coniocarpon cinnabarinum]
MAATAPQTQDERTPLLRKPSQSQQPLTPFPTPSSPPAEDPIPPVPAPTEPSTPRLTLILASTWLGVFLSALDTTILATLSSPISESFESFTLFSWLASSYLIANAALQPLSGKLTDIFGRRNGLLWANAFFAAGTLICGLARAEWVIILGRVVAGLGGGCLNTITTFVASDLVPLRRRGLIQGLANIFFGLGSGVGGVYGGWISDVWNWRAAFLIQVPLIVLSAIIVGLTLNIPVKETDKSKIKRVDFSGAAALVTTLVLLLLGLNSGGNIVPWSHPMVYVSLALSVVAFAVYIYVEEKVASEPVIPVRLMLKQTVAAACLSNWFASMAWFSFLYYGPIYFEVLGYSSGAAGARLIPPSIGAAFGSLGSGFVMRATGKYYILNAVLTGVMVASAGLSIGVLNGASPEWQPFVVFAFFGVGYASLITITLLALISAVDHEHQAVITSASYAFRSTGSTIGISISSAIFANLLKIRLWENIGGEEGAAQWISRIRDDLGVLKLLPDELRDRALQAALEALRSVWWTGFILSVLAWIFGLMMKENVLHKNLERTSTR